LKFTGVATLKFTGVATFSNILFLVIWWLLCIRFAKRRLSIPLQFVAREGKLSMNERFPSLKFSKKKKSLEKPSLQARNLSKHGHARYQKPWFSETNAMKLSDRWFGDFRKKLEKKKSKNHKNMVFSTLKKNHKNMVFSTYKKTTKTWFFQLQ
jgi:hypothetical protein